MHQKKVILWFRQDLRLHDNEALQEALSITDDIIPIYVFDERAFRSKTIFGFPKTGEHRAQFIIDCVSDLRHSLQSIGSDLIVRVGTPEDVIYELALQNKSNYVFCNRERTGEELKVQDALEQNLWTIGQEIRFSRGKMLYYTADLPFPVTHTPDTFASFRKEVERFIPVREPFKKPDKMKKYFGGIDPGEIPSLEELLDVKSINHFEKTVVGGETQALTKLNESFTKDYKNSNGIWPSLNNLDTFFTQLSPYLSQGCLSPKYFFYAFKERASGNGLKDNLDLLFQRLMYRDFLRLMAKKYGGKIFNPGGINGKELEFATTDRLFEIWAKGKTGIPIVDASMRQLNQTGVLSHRSRLITAHFLIHVLNVDWRKGASYFESKLIDYDPCTNWVSWVKLAGLGPDGKTEKSINYIYQAKKNDPQGSYVKHWLPELGDLESPLIHTPDQIPEGVYDQFTLGKDYPKAIVSTERWS